MSSARTRVGGASRARSLSKAQRPPRSNRGGIGNDIRRARSLEIALGMSAARGASDGVAASPKRVPSSMRTSGEFSFSLWLHSFVCSFSFYGFFYLLIYSFVCLYSFVCAYRRPAAQRASRRLRAPRTRGVRSPRQGARAVAFGKRTRCTCPAPDSMCSRPSGACNCAPLRRRSPRWRVAPQRRAAERRAPRGVPPPPRSRPRPMVAKSSSLRCRGAGIAAEPLRCNIS